MPSPTCTMPSTDEYPGPYNFEIQIDSRSAGKKWMVGITCSVKCKSLKLPLINTDCSLHKDKGKTKM
jgi:hypothetical protein